MNCYFIYYASMQWNSVEQCGRYVECYPFPISLHGTIIAHLTQHSVVHLPSCSLYTRVGRYTAVPGVVVNGRSGTHAEFGLGPGVALH